jgi:hypothetical protein
LVSLVCRSTHAPPHEVSIPRQLGTHAPDEHTSVLRQALSQAPQFEGSVAVSVHCVAHKSCPPGQTHEPAAHVRPAAHD